MLHRLDAVDRARLALIGLAGRDHLALVATKLKRILPVEPFLSTNLAAIHPPLNRSGQLGSRIQPRVSATRKDQGLTPCLPCHPHERGSSTTAPHRTNQADQHLQEPQWPTPSSKDTIGSMLARDGADGADLQDHSPARPRMPAVPQQQSVRAIPVSSVSRNCAGTTEAACVGAGGCAAQGPRRRWGRAAPRGRGHGVPPRCGPGSGRRCRGG